MRSLRDLEPGQELECWGTRDSEEADVFLRGEEGLELVGRLTGTPEGFESADGSWTIETSEQRSGSWWRPSSRVIQIVTERPSNVEVVRTEETHWSGFWVRPSPFVFASGREYHFGFIGFGRRWVFQKNGVRVLTFTMPAWSWGGNEIHLVVTVARGARAVEHDLPILVLLGCRMAMEVMRSATG